MRRFAGEWPKTISLPGSPRFRRLDPCHGALPLCTSRMTSCSKPASGFPPTPPPSCAVSSRRGSASGSSGPSSSICQAPLSNERMRKAESDLLFRVPCDSGTAFVYILFEHQHDKDKWIALRLSYYIHQIRFGFPRQASRHRETARGGAGGACPERDLVGNPDAVFGVVRSAPGRERSAARLVPDFTFRLDPACGHLFRGHPRDEHGRDDPAGAEGRAAPTSCSARRCGTSPGSRNFRRGFSTN
jgi:hypothetical protein